MLENKIIDAKSVFLRCKSLRNLEAELASAGWISTFRSLPDESTLQVYVVDTIVPSVALIGLNRADFMKRAVAGKIHWGHFVLAWDVLVDPELPHDDVHRISTMNLLIDSLATTTAWLKIKSEILGQPYSKIFIAVDRSNMEEPGGYRIERSENISLNYSEWTTVLGSSDL